MLAEPAPAAASPSARFGKGDPEPLQLFPHLSEGFHRTGAHVVYVDERHAAWAPRGIDASGLAPVPLASADVAEVVARLRRRHWVWAVEHAALVQLDSDRPLALRLLEAAIDHDLKSPDRVGAALRLYDLTAAVLSHAPAAELAAFAARLGHVAQVHPVLAQRLEKWRSPQWRTRVAQQLSAATWRAAASDGSTVSIRLAPAHGGQFS